MAEPYISEIRIFSFNFAPAGWAACNGQLLPISQYQALFTLLGTTYGGDGTSNFALPNLQGRVPLCAGSNFAQGQQGGEAAVTLAADQLPQHTHMVQANSGADTNVGSNATVPGGGGAPGYGGPPDTDMNAAIVGNAGGGGAHSNMQPYLALNFCIYLFPSQS